MSNNLTINDILKVTNGKLIIGNKDDIAIKYSIDTRKLDGIDTYIGIKGEKVDGSNFYKDAFDKGAKTVIINNIKLDDIDKYQDKNIIIVENTRIALGQIAKLKRSLYPNLLVVGVTGSVGKTSTKDIIASVLSKKYKTLKTEGNNNNDLGLPLTILRLQNEEAAVIEMGMNHEGEIDYLTNIAKPTISIITNIGTAHIGNLGSRENILKAKLEILNGMAEKNLIINNDNDMLHNWYIKNKDINVLTFGIDNKSDIFANNIVLDENSSHFTLNYLNNKEDININIGGKVFIYNALAAALIGIYFNIDIEDIKKGLESFILTQKRMEIIKINNNITLINDAYNASFDSMKASLEYLSNLKNGRKIAVLADMLELGNFSKEIHNNVGKLINNKIDILILTGNDAKYIKDGAISNGFNEDKIFYLKDNKEVEYYIKNIMKDDDNILFKASNGLKLYEVVNNLINDSKVS